LANGGFDWVCVDRQLAAIDERDLTEIARATVGSAAALHVRVRSNTAAEIGFALDVGARIVVVPMVDSAVDAHRAVSAAYYPPLGRRSWGQLSSMWSNVVPAVEANACTGVWALIETPEGLENAAEIAAVPGITGLFVGPYDLSFGLGITLDELLAADGKSGPLARVAETAKSAGITAAAYAGKAAVAAVLAAAGFTDIAIVTDVALIDDAIARTVGTG
jgi:4-hydroxy-2-oxoheptanedioate aldolase